MLHDDKVWQCLQIALRELDKKNVKATFLVYPFRSIIAGKDITERVKELAERGHEIGQHTHFYVGMKTDRPDKRNDLSDSNIRACITRDYQWLKDCGVEPKGFCAGAWLMTEAVLEALAELGFLYDCSARLPHFRMNFEMPHLWSESAQVRVFNGYPLVLLPTTNVITIFEYLHPKRQRQRALMVNSIDYHLIYNHDYDLLKWKVRMGLLVWIGMVQNINTAQQLAEIYLKG
jgi:peptidoglycan/xylan/chitin deacetylase (PgdA/CDA1 family)